MADGWFSVPVLPAVLCLGLSSIKGAHGGDYCPPYADYAIYCEYGCCGAYDHKCCDMDVPMIVGSVVGGILCIAIIVTVVCCILKKQGYRGRVVGPHPLTTGAGNNVTVVHANNPMAYATAPPPSYPYPQPSYYGPGPGSMSQPPPPPTYYSATNPAYPPPPFPANSQKPEGSGQGFAAPAHPAYTPFTGAP